MRGERSGGGRRRGGKEEQEEEEEEGEGEEGKIRKRNGEDTVYNFIPTGLTALLKWTHFLKITAYHSRICY